MRRNDACARNPRADNGRGEFKGGAVDGRNDIDGDGIDDDDNWSDGDFSFTPIMRSVLSAESIVVISAASKAPVLHYCMH